MGATSKPPPLTLYFTGEKTSGTPVVRVAQQRYGRKLTLLCHPMADIYALATDKRTI